jgi:hypothetical protein
MKVIIDREKLRRRASLSHTASLGGLLTLLGSVGLSLWKPDLQTLTTVIMLVGGVVAIVGIYYANRWVKKPRPEEVLDSTLKGLKAGYRMYHYTALPCAHVLLTPGGVVVLETRNLDGAFTYEDGRWKQKMTPSRAMRFFVEEQLGDPIESALACAHQLESMLAARLPGDVTVPVNAVVVFIHPAAEVKVRKAPIPVTWPKKLRGSIPKDLPKLPPDVYDQVQALFDEAAGLEDEK